MDILFIGRERISAICQVIVRHGGFVLVQSRPTPDGLMSAVEREQDPICPAEGPYQSCTRSLCMRPFSDPN